MLDESIGNRNARVYLHFFGAGAYANKDVNKDSNRISVGFSR